MTFLRRVLGLDAPASPDLPIDPDAPLPGPAVGDSASVRRIAPRLMGLGPSRARYLAAFAYLLGRAADADHRVTDAEWAEMERLVAETGGLDTETARLVVELAHFQSGEFGATEDDLVTREFRAISTEEERLALLRCCLLVMAADDEVVADEAWLVNRLAEELGIERPELNRVRSEFHDRYSGVREIRRHRGG
jgi:uncharacterized tellurite resistance protein B-like protein